MATSGRTITFERTPTFYDAGVYKVEGQTLEDGVAKRARVLMFRSDSFAPIRDVWTGADGAFSFTNLKYSTYHVIAIDKTAERNLAGYSFVTPVAM